MRKTLLALLVGVGFVGLVFGQGSNRERSLTAPSGPEIRAPIKLFDSVAVTNANVASSALGLDRYRPLGMFSVQLIVTGTGTVSRVVYEVSNDGVNFVQPVGASDIYTNFTATSGVASNGVDLQGFQPPVAGYLRLRVYATNGVSTVSAYLCMQ